MVAIPLWQESGVRNKLLFSYMQPGMIIPYLKVTHCAKIESLWCCCYGNSVSSLFFIGERRTAGCIQSEEGWGQNNSCSKIWKAFNFPVLVAIFWSAYSDSDPFTMKTNRFWLSCACRRNISTKCITLQASALFEGWHSSQLASCPESWRLPRKG